MARTYRIKKTLKVNPVEVERELLKYRVYTWARSKDEIEYWKRHEVLDSHPGMRNAPAWYRRDDNKIYRHRLNHEIRNFIAQSKDFDDFDLKGINRHKNINYSWF